jgi:glycosyltransferase involved in cell wall biosynthesis
VRVAFDSRPTAAVRGVGRYSRCILEALREAAPRDVEIVETHRPSATVRARRVDLFHSPWLEGAILRSPCPMVLTLHDLAALKRASEHLRGGVRLRMRRLAAQRALRAIVPTETVRRDAVQRLGLVPERVTVIGEAPDPSMYARSAAEVSDVRERYSLPERYLLWVGSLRHPDPRKQVAQLVAAPRELPLVLVGPTRPWAHELDGAILTGQVSDDELAAIYSGAHALVLASEEEGFGLPAVEALACGTPVAACEAPALREVLRERASFVEVGDMRALIDAAQSIGRPAPPPPSWSWRDAADATLRVYGQALAEARERSHARGWSIAAKPRAEAEAELE